MKSSTKYIKILANLIWMLVIVLFVCFVLPKVISLTAPFIIAAIIARAASPIVKFAESKLRIKRKLGSAIVIIFALSLVVGAIYLVASLLIDETMGFIQSMPLWNNSISDTLLNMGKYPMSAATRGHLEAIFNSITLKMSDFTSNITQSVSDMFSNIALTVVSIIFCILSSYLFIVERDTLTKFYSKVPNRIKNVINMIGDTTGFAVLGYFKAQLKIMFFVFIVLLGGFLVLGIKYPVVIALLVAMLDFLPLFGTGTVMIPWGIILLVQKNYKIGLGILVVWALSQLVRQLIQPKLLGQSVGISALPTVIILYLGYRIYGAIGLIISVPVALILFGLYKSGIFDNFIISVKLLYEDISKLCDFKDEG